MEVLIKSFFYISLFVIFWAMVGYPLSLKLINKLYKSKQLVRDYTHLPTVTIMVVAHNEEKVILNKLKNIVNLDYPNDKIKFLISSDNSTDGTNEIVKKFIAEHSMKNIKLYEVKSRQGKTNAQNEARKTVTTEYLVMTDANSILEKKSIRELMATFVAEDIAYVTGKLEIINQSTSDVSGAESSYWNTDLAVREIESRIQTITAGNGALYAVRTKDYHDFDPIQSHDSAMPIYYALNKKRALFNRDAIAYEKAGEVIEDEFGRKVRMNRVLLNHIVPDIKIMNIFKYKWFTYFYFGHRTCRYLLWIAHLILFTTNIILIFSSWLYLLTLIGQLMFFGIALAKSKQSYNGVLINLVYYYTVTIIAQWVGVYRILTGKAKPFWEKAESTR